MLKHETVFDLGIALVSTASVACLDGHGQNLYNVPQYNILLESIANNYWLDTCSLVASRKPISSTSSTLDISRC